MIRSRALLPQPEAQERERILPGDGEVDAPERLDRSGDPSLKTLSTPLIVTALAVVVIALGEVTRCPSPAA